MLFRSSLILRIAVGLYLFYTIYMLQDALHKYTGMELAFYIAAVVIFGIIAVILLVHSGYSLIKGQYTSGAQDEDSADEKDNEDE